MERKQLKDIKNGEFFRIRESDTAPVWVKTGERIRRQKMTKYECHQYEDANHNNFFGSDKVVYVGFEY